ncbi:MAG: hypothetical protein QOE70_6484 [Chthoniobacter sp.]|nr:hypothetical protein [Chthoniobacter sp.]
MASAVSPSFANNGDSFEFGATNVGNGGNNGTSPSRMVYNGGSGGGASGKLLFMFEDGNKYATTDFGNFGSVFQDGGAVLSGIAALGTNTAGTPIGVFGFSERPFGTGVAGLSSTYYGVYGESLSPDYSGVFGYSSNDVGVFGQSDNNTGAGVFGYSETTAGVRGYSGTKEGVFGESGTDTGVYGTGRIGGEFSGQEVNVLLPDQNPALPDPTTTNGIAYEAGSLLKQGNQTLWYNVESGSPGKWRELAGPSTAGALHLLMPGARFIDTRRGLGGAMAPFVGDQVRSYNIIALSGGRIPAGATGIVGNITVANATGDGFGQINIVNGFPLGTPSNVNFLAGNNVNGAFTVALDPAGQVFVRMFIQNGGGTADMIFDVTGYYR